MWHMWNSILEECSVWTGEVKPSTEGLYARELELVNGMATLRQHEFACGRHCAHRALEGLGLQGRSILLDGQGVPIWPHGVVGSISHSRGYCVAAAARTDRLYRVGLDVEWVDRFNGGQLPFYGSAGDLEEIKDVLPWITETQSQAILFSAKESVYKGLGSLSKSPLGLKSIELTWLSSMEFQLDKVSLSSIPLPKGASISGRSFFFEGWVGTAVLVKIEKVHD